MRVEWNGSVKKALAAVLYVVGATLVLYVYYEARATSVTATGYIYPWGIGVILVALAALLWPKGGLPETEHERRGSDADKEEAS